METSEIQASQRQFPCRQCGASLVFEPGTTSLKCPYCGTANDIAPLAEIIEELDFRTHASQHAPAGETQETLAVRCTACGAETDFTHDVAASKCPFCGAGIVATAWFFARDGKQEGPVDMADLEQGVRLKQVSRDTLVWRKGMPQWTKAADVPELQDLLSDVPPPLPLG